MAGVLAHLQSATALAAPSPPPAPVSPLPGPSPATSRRVLLIVERPRDAFAERIRSEVVGLGLPVVVLETWRTREAVGPLETAARAQHAVAAIRMLPTRKGVEVWMADETSGRSLLRQLVIDESPGGPDEGLIALQTAELMRTSLLSRPRTGDAPAAGGASAVEGAHPGGSSGRARARDPSTPDVTATEVGAGGPASLSSTTTGVDASLGVLYSPTAGGPALQAWLAVHHALASRWEVALDLSAPLRSPTLSGPEGTARVAAYLVGIGLLWRGMAAADRFFVNGGGGMAVVRVTADGTAAAPLTGGDASATTGAGYLRSDAGLALTRSLRVGVRVVAGATVGRVALKFAGNEAGVWGRPFLAGLAVVDLRW